jgi:exosome complex component RRP43
VSSNFIAETLTNSRCVDLRDLCIAPEHLAWVLHCDLICLDHDGSLLDACVIALVAALRTGMYQQQGETWVCTAGCQNII